MDFDIREDIRSRKSVEELIDEFCASTDADLRAHDSLSINSLLILSDKSLRVCSSDVLSERTALATRAEMEFDSLGVRLDTLLDDDRIGMCYIRVIDPDSELENLDMFKVYLVREAMHDALRVVLIALARETQRTMLVCDHLRQFAVNDPDAVVVDHIHILYTRRRSDSPTFIKDSIFDLVSKDVKWENVLRNLGLAETALTALRDPESYDPDYEKEALSGDGSMSAQAGNQSEDDWEDVLDDPDNEDFFSDDGDPDVEYDYEPDDDSDVDPDDYNEYGEALGDSEPDFDDGPSDDVPF